MIHRSQNGFVKKKNPAFSYKNEQIRVIVAIVLGSNVFVEGTKNIGPTKVWNDLQRFVNEEENKLEGIIFNWTSGVLKANFEELETILSVILYEPTIEINIEEPFRYIYIESQNDCLSVFKRF